MEVSVDEEFNEVEIFLSPSELRSLALHVRQRAEFDCSPTKKSSIEGIWLKTIKFTASRDDDLLCISARDHVLVVDGQGDSLDWLSLYFEELADSPGFGHVHIEWFDAHPKLAPESIALIVAEDIGP